MEPFALMLPNVIGSTGFVVFMSGPGLLHSLIYNALAVVECNGHIGLSSAVCRTYVAWSRRHCLTIVEIA